MSPSANVTMTKLGEKDRKAQRRKAFELALHDDHLIAIGQVALRGDNLIDLTAEQLIQRHSPIIRKELSKFTTAKKIDLIKEALTQDMPESSNDFSVNSTRHVPRGMKSFTAPGGRRIPLKSKRWSR